MAARAAIALLAAAVAWAGSALALDDPSCAQYREPRITPVSPATGPERTTWEGCMGEPNRATARLIAVGAAGQGPGRRGRASMDGSARNVRMDGCTLSFRFGEPGQRLRARRPSPRR